VRARKGRQLDQPNCEAQEPEPEMKPFSDEYNMKPENLYSAVQLRLHPKCASQNVICGPVLPVYQPRMSRILRKPSDHLMFELTTK
jgi:hypothetical protein